MLSGEDVQRAGVSAKMDRKGARQELLSPPIRAAGVAIALFGGVSALAWWGRRSEAAVARRTADRLAPFSSAAAIDG